MGVIFTNGLGVGTVPNNTNLYSPTFGQWLLMAGPSGFQPAWTNGVLTIPDFPDNVGFNDLNPIVAQAPLGLYINGLDASGVEQYMLVNLLNQSGSISFTQGSNYITLAYQSGSFQGASYFGAGQVYYDPSTAPMSLISTSNTTFNGYFDGDGAPGPLTHMSSSIAPNNSELIDIVIHTDTTFTIESSMILGLNSTCSAADGLPNGTSGFTKTQPNNYVGCGVYGATTNNTSIINAFANAGIATNDNSGYICSVEWGPGSSVKRGYAKVAFQAQNGFLTIDTIDPSNANNFNNDSGTDGLSLVGTFNFPATFTLINPLDNKGGWC
jgi:hypothetical protein